MTHVRKQPIQFASLGLRRHNLIINLALCADPQGFDCANPYVWTDGALPTNFGTLHLQQSPTTPYSLIEFQGGSFDPWGGPGFAKCETLTNEEFERVFYKNDFSFGVTIFNVYMTYGGETACF